MDSPPIIGYRDSEIQNKYLMKYNNFPFFHF